MASDPFESLERILHSLSELEKIWAQSCWYLTGCISPWSTATTVSLAHLSKCRRNPEKWALSSKSSAANQLSPASWSSETNFTVFVNLGFVVDSLILSTFSTFSSTFSSVFSLACSSTTSWRQSVHSGSGNPPIGIGSSSKHWSSWLFQMQFSGLKLNLDELEKFPGWKKLGRNFFLLENR